MTENLKDYLNYGYSPRFKTIDFTTIDEMYSYGQKNATRRINQDYNKGMEKLKEEQNVIVKRNLFQSNSSLFEVNNYCIENFQSAYLTRDSVNLIYPDRVKVANDKNKQFILDFINRIKNDTNDYLPQRDNLTITRFMNALLDFCEFAFSIKCPQRVLADNVSSDDILYKLQLSTNVEKRSTMPLLGKLAPQEIKTKDRYASWIRRFLVDCGVIYCVDDDFRSPLISKAPRAKSFIIDYKNVKFIHNFVVKELGYKKLKEEIEEQKPKKKTKQPQDLHSFLDKKTHLFDFKSKQRIDIPLIYNKEDFEPIIIKKLDKKYNGALTELNNTINEINTHYSKNSLLRMHANVKFTYADKIDSKGNLKEVHTITKTSIRPSSSIANKPKHDSNDFYISAMNELNLTSIDDLLEVDVKSSVPFLTYAFNTDNTDLLGTDFYSLFNTELIKLLEQEVNDNKVIYRKIKKLEYLSKADEKFIYEFEFIANTLKRLYTEGFTKEIRDFNKRRYMPCYFPITSGNVVAKAAYMLSDKDTNSKYDHLQKSAFKLFLKLYQQALTNVCGLSFGSKIYLFEALAYTQITKKLLNLGIKCFQQYDAWYIDKTTIPTHIENISDFIQNEIKANVKHYRKLLGIKDTKQPKEKLDLTKLTEEQFKQLQRIKFLQIAGLANKQNIEKVLKERELNYQIISETDKKLSNYFLSLQSQAKISSLTKQQLNIIYTFYHTIHNFQSPLYKHFYTQTYKQISELQKLIWCYYFKELQIIQNPQFNELPGIGTQHDLCKKGSEVYDEVYNMFDGDFLRAVGLMN